MIGGPGFIFCSKVGNLELDENGQHFDNALDHALDSENPTVGVYDASKMLEQHHPRYKVLDDSALVALIKIRT